MKSVIEALEGNKVKVSVEVEAQEFEEALDAAFKKIAREVRVPGFRPGRAPRRILEARLGKEAGRAEALRGSVPDYYAWAVREHQVDAIAPPEIDITAGEADGDVAFDAVVEIRPHLHLVGYQGLRIEIPSPVVSEEDIARHLDRLRGNFAELATVDRPAADGDNLTIDLRGTREGEDVSGMTLDDYLYELGSGSLLPEVDEKLQGVKAGDVVTFPSESTNSEVTVEVKEVKEKVLPEITDEWASDASEFDTVEELRADIVKRLTTAKRAQSSMAMRSGTITALVALVEDEPPKALVDTEIERQANDLGRRLEAQGATLAQWLAATGQSEQDVVAELRAAAGPAVKADLALRAVAEAEEIDPTEDDLEIELARMAANYQLPVGELRAQLERTGQMPAVRSDLKKSKALEWLVEHVELVDAEGNPVDRAALALTEVLEMTEVPDAVEAPKAPEASEDTSVAAPVESGEA